MIYGLKKCQVPNGKCRMHIVDLKKFTIYGLRFDANGEWQMPNAKCQMPNDGLKQFTIYDLQNIKYKFKIIFRIFLKVLSARLHQPELPPRFCLPDLLFVA